MRRSRPAPRRLAELLPRLAAEAGAQRLRRAALEAGVESALGEWLAGRLNACRRDGDALELEIAGEAAAAQVERLADEVLERLAGELGPGAPRRLRVRRCAAPAPSRPAEPRALPETFPAAGPLATEALEELEDPGLRAQLARITGRATGSSMEAGQGGR